MNGRVEAVQSFGNICISKCATFNSILLTSDSVTVPMKILFLKTKDKEEKLYKT